MKRIIFSMVGSMLIGLGAVQAQEYDTAGRASKSKQQSYEQSQQRDNQRQQKDQAWQQKSDSQNQYANEGMVIIEKDEIPASLKQTLKKEKYAGWENGTIYHNTNTGEFVIAPRAYRFDESGKEMEMGAANQGYGSRDGRQSRYSQGQNNDQQSQQYPERTSQSQQGQDQRSESSTYSSGNQSDNNSNPSQSQRDQSSETQPQSYDQASETQQRSYEQSTGNQQRNPDQSTGTQQRSYDQSSQGQQDQSTNSQDQSNAYRTDQSKQTQRDGQQTSSSYRNGQDASTSGQPGQSSQSQYRTEDMTEIQAEQIPASLRRTLRESQYSGWEESGTLYQDPATRDYVLVMEKSGDSSQPRSYRFDKNGQVKDDQTGSSQKNQKNKGQ